MTDTMGRMHGDAQFAGSSSVPAHVEMMGLIGMGNNPMVGCDGCLRGCRERGFEITILKKRELLAPFFDADCRKVQAQICSRPSIYHKQVFRNPLFGQVGVNQPDKDGAALHKQKTVGVFYASVPV